MFFGSWFQCESQADNHENHNNFFHRFFSKFKQLQSSDDNDFIFIISINFKFTIQINNNLSNFNKKHIIPNIGKQNLSSQKQSYRTQMNIIKSQQTMQQKSRKKNGQEVYFEGNKKNQLNELKNYFKTILYDQSKAYVRKEIIKRIINDTTRGVDTSRMFPQMVLASSTKDLVEKKMIYFYLINFSKGNDSFARMAINTFLKDAGSHVPSIRALSLRHLSNLRFKGRDEYVLPLLKKGLSDLSPLVKKSSIMGLTKMITDKQKLVEQPEREQELLNQLYSLIRDPDTGVVCCTLEAINEIQPEGLVMNKKLATYLLDNLQNFEEYQLPTILKYFELYEPKSQEQMVNTMNILFSKLRTSVLSITLAISKIYLRYGEIYPQYLSGILQKLKRPLLSFLNNQSPQIQYVALKHIEYMIQKYHVDFFRKDIKKFFIQYNEKTYIKVSKIKIIELNTKEDNFVDMINELAEYLSDEEISKEAVKALERLMMRTEKQKDSKFIIKTIIKVIEITWNDYLCNNALPTIRNFLRKHKGEFGLLQEIFYTLVNQATESEAKCSIIEIIGDYGEHIEDAIELVQWNQKQQSDSVKISMLRANVKLFLKRPLQMLNIVTAMFNQVLSSDQEQLYVKEYAGFLYRGLQRDIQNFKKIFLQTRSRQQMTQAQLPRLQIDTLEIVYQRQQYKWIIEKDKFLNTMGDEIQYEDGERNGQYQQEITDNQDGVMRKTSTDIKNSINFDSIYRTLEAEDFDNEFQIDPEQFQQKWEQYEVGASITRIVKKIDFINEQNLEELFKIWNIGVMASAEDDDTIKLYLYCKIKHFERTELALLQLQVIKAAETMTLMIKSEDEELSGFISKYVEEFLKLNEMI